MLRKLRGKKAPEAQEDVRGYDSFNPRRGEGGGGGGRGRYNSYEEDRGRGGGRGYSDEYDDETEYEDETQYGGDDYTEYTRDARSPMPPRVSLPFEVFDFLQRRGDMRRM